MKVKSIRKLQCRLLTAVKFVETVHPENEYEDFLRSEALRALNKGLEQLKKYLEKALNDI